MKTKTLYLPIAVLIFIFFSFKFQSSGQTTGPSFDEHRFYTLTLEELINLEVTAAGKKEEKMQEIPASVEIITREDIETYGYSSLSEIIANITGYYEIDDLGHNYSLPGVRGFMSPNCTGAIILINGISQDRKGLENYSLRESNVPVECIDRIEVIRGPMSVMYGTGAFYGVINIITNENNDDKISGHVSVSAGSLKTKKASIGVSGKEGNFQYDINTGYRYSYGRNFPLTEMTKDLTKFELTNSSPDTDGRLEGTDKYFDLSIKAKPFYGKMTFMETMQETYGVLATNGDGTSLENSKLNLMIGLDKDFSTKFNLNASFRYTFHNFYLNTSWYKTVYYGKEDIRSSAYDMEIRANYSPNNKTNITLGVAQKAMLNYFMIWDYTDFGFIYNNHVRELDPTDKVTTSSAFLQLDYSPIPKLKIVAGLRVEKMHDYDFTQSFGSDTTGTNSTITRTITHGHFDSEGVVLVPRFAALYHFDKHNTLKFFYGEGIKHPTFDENSLNIAHINVYGNLKSEKIRTYELNYTTTISSKLNIKTSFFYNQLENLISRVWTSDNQGGFVTHQENAGSFTTKGAELSLLYSPIENLRIRLSSSYQKTKDERKGFENVDVAYSPDFLGYVGVSYKIDRYSLGISGNYMDEIEAFWSGQSPKSDFPGARIGETADGYFLLNTNLRANDLFDKGFYINMKVSNILNTKYIIPTTTVVGWADKGHPGFERQFLFSLGWKF